MRFCLVYTFCDNNIYTICYILHLQIFFYGTIIFLTILYWWDRPPEFNIAVKTKTSRNKVPFSLCESVASTLTRKHKKRKQMFINQLHPVKPHDFMVQMGTTMTKITVQVAAAISAPILHTLARLNAASFLLSKES